MANIHLLENSLINKIAAGEVVERPASVVKELMENSIDAGATSISVEIKEGGISLIKIVDNGKGIEKDEIKTAFLRHATSKLNSFEDLENILTLGFRGEALSSIASVSKVEMATRTKESEVGNRIFINGGVIEKMDEVGMNVGTCFIMRDLFYNTPARRKFLKKAATEGSQISEVINKIAMGHPEIAIRYVNNSNTILQTSGSGDVKDCIMKIYGSQVAKELIKVEYEKSEYKVSGYIAKPSLSRGNRGYGNFFINGRYIKSSLVQNAVEEAYKGKIMVQKFPVFALNLKTPKNSVDVNVHPTKLEVRFADENLIYDLIYDCVSKALKSENLIPSVEWGKKKVEKAKSVQVEIDDLKYDEKPIQKEELSFNSPLKNEKCIEESKKENNINSFKNVIETLYSSEKKEEKKEDVFKKLETQKVETPKVIEKVETPKETEVKKERKPFFNNYTIVGQVFGTYWIVEQNASMYLIDQHAAHERALYEELVEKFRNYEIASQQLLHPIAVNLTEREKVVVEENMELLEKFGFEVEEFGFKAYALRAVPYIFDKPSDVSFFTDIVDMLGRKKINGVYETKEDAIATMSCKAAVKGNSVLSYLEAKELIKKLLELENPFNCPHGRPTIIEMSKYEVEKKFKRVKD